jgi:hypothetical protein
MTRFACAASMVVLFAVCALAQDRRDNLIGVWKMNAERSNFRVRPELSTPPCVAAKIASGPMQPWSNAYDPPYSISQLSIECKKEVQSER